VGIEEVNMDDGKQSNNAGDAFPPPSTHGLENLSKEELVRKVKELELELKQADEQVSRQYAENSQLKKKVAELSSAGSGVDGSNGKRSNEELEELKVQLRSSEDEVHRLNTIVATLKVADSNPLAVSGDGSVGEIQILRSQLEEQKESRRSAIDAWEAAERKVAEAEERAVVSIKEMQNGVRQMEDAKWEAEKKLKWQVSKTEEVQARIEELEAEIEQKNAEIMELQVNLNSARINARAADQMERLKTQATIESMQRDMMWRERMFNNALHNYKARLENRKLVEMKLQKTIGETQLQLLYLQQRSQQQQIAAFPKDRPDMHAMKQYINQTKAQISQLDKKIHFQTEQSEKFQSNQQSLSFQPLMQHPLPMGMMPPQAAPDSAPAGMSNNHPNQNNFSSPMSPTMPFNPAIVPGQMGVYTNNNFSPVQGGGKDSLETFMAKQPVSKTPPTRKVAGGKGGFYWDTNGGGGGGGKMNASPKGNNSNMKKSPANRGRRTKSGPSNGAKKGEGPRWRR